MRSAIARLQLRHFQLIRTIDDLGQLSLAAERLAMTQPAASRSLSEVERLVGAPVFLRHPKGMTATPVGEVLVRHAGLLLSGLDQAADELVAFRSGATGVVRVGAVTGASVAFVVPAIRRLKQEAGNPEVRVDVAPSVDLMQGLMQGEYDFVLSRVTPGIDATQLQVLRGRPEHMEFLVRAGHPLAGGPRPSLKQLADYTWVVQAPGMPIREAVDRAHLAAGLPPPQDVVNSASLLVVLAFISETDAISPAAREVSDLVRAMRADGVATFFSHEPITLPPYHLIRLKSRPLSPVAQRLLELVLEGLSA